jgi:hypothetical protein
MSLEHTTNVISQSQARSVNQSGRASTPTLDQDLPQRTNQPAAAVTTAATVTTASASAAASNPSTRIPCAGHSHPYSRRRRRCRPSGKKMEQRQSFYEERQRIASGRRSQAAAKRRERQLRQQRRIAVHAAATATTIAGSTMFVSASESQSVSGVNLDGSNNSHSYDVDSQLASIVLGDDLSSDTDGSYSSSYWNTDTSNTISSQETSPSSRHRTVTIQPTQTQEQAQPAAAAAATAAHAWLTLPSGSCTYTSQTHRVSPTSVSPMSYDASSPKQSTTRRIDEHLARSKNLLKDICDMQGLDPDAETQTALLMMAASQSDPRSILDALKEMQRTRHVDTA